MVNRANCPNMVEEGRCAIPWEIQRHHISKSHHIMKLLRGPWMARSEREYSKNYGKNNSDSERENED